MAARRQPLLLSVFLGAAVLAGSGTACATDSTDHYGRKAEGWYWYKDPAEKKKEEKPKAEPPPKPPEPAPKKKAEPPRIEPRPFSVAWLRQNYDRLRDEAMDDPKDPDKMKAYLYASRIILDTAQNFATEAHRMSNSDPLLDETNRIPLDTAAKFAVMQGWDADKKDALKELAKKGGIFFFFDSSCSHCATQLQALDWLKKDYGFAIKNISVDGKPLPGMTQWVRDEGQSRALGLKITPTTLFVMPPAGYYIISQGFHSAETLGEKILLVAGSKNLLPPELAKKIEIFQRGVLTPEDLRDPALAAAGDSKEWVKRVQEMIGGEQK